MNAAKYIEENLNPMRILQHYGFRQITEKETEIRACCEIHKGDNPTGFVWNKKNNLWFCYTGECSGGDVFNLIQKMSGVNFATAVEIAASILGLSIEGMDIIPTQNRLEIEQQRWLNKQRKRIKKYEQKEYTLSGVQYLSQNPDFSRFDDETLNFYNARFCKEFPTEHSILYDKLIIPLYDGNICVGVALRDTTGNHLPKWIYQPSGIKTSHLLYNEKNALHQLDVNFAKEIILVEGIFDVWAYHTIGINNVVAILGSSISEEQYKKLLLMGTSLALSFDNDKAGQKCTLSAIEIFKGKTDTRIIRLPEGKDPADCDKEELLNAYLAGVKKH